MNKYDGIINKPPLETLMHFNPNHDPTNGQFTTGSGGGGSNKANSKNKSLKIESETDGYIVGTLKDKKTKNSVFIMGDSKDGITKDKIKESAKIFSKNEQKIMEAAKQAIKEDSSLMEFMKSNSGLSEKEIFNNLEIGSVFINANKRFPSEVSVYDKFRTNGIDLLYGHSLDMEIDISKPKKPKWVAMNG